MFADGPNDRSQCANMAFGVMCVDRRANAYSPSGPCTASPEAP